MEAVNVSGDGMGQRSSAQYPNFNQILSGNASEPYTLESFVDYLSQNHCIEILDFLSDAKTYVEAYRASAPDICATKMTSDSRRLGKQWKSLMSTYIIRAAPDEINLPEYIRAALLDRANVMILPPSPATLEPAICYAHELLTESALLPFIQSIRSSGNFIHRNNGNNGSNGNNHKIQRNRKNENFLNNGSNSLSSSREAHNNMHAVPGASSERNLRYVPNINAQKISNKVYDYHIGSFRSQDLMNHAFRKDRSRRVLGAIESSGVCLLRD